MATKTANGATAFVSTGCARLDLFYSLTRNASLTLVQPLLAKAWKEDAKQVVQILLHARDCRHGKGEKLIVYLCLIWMRRTYPASYFLNLRNFLGVGTYKDLLQLAYLARQGGARAPYPELEVMATDLRRDAAILLSNSPFTGKMPEYLERLELPKTSAATGISLAAKWAPNEHSHFDSLECGRMAEYLANMLYGRSLPYAKKLYRQLLVFLRTRLNLVECLMSSHQWSSINFATVPSIAHHHLRKAFTQHETERYRKYLYDVKRGKQEIKSVGLQAHQLVSQYLSICPKEGHYPSLNFAAVEDPTLEAQWTALLNRLRKDESASKNLGRSLAMVDVSQSMRHIDQNSKVAPLAASLAMGLIVATLAKAPFQDHCMTFSELPVFHKIEGTTLLERIKSLCECPYHTSTNIMSAFELLLNLFKEGKIEELPQRVFVLSDMEFDKPLDMKQLPSIVDAVKSQYQASDLQLPQCILWNLKATPTLHVPINDSQVPGMSIVSGFSQEFLSVFLHGENFGPLSIMHRAINRYQGCATVAFEDL